MIAAASIERRVRDARRAGARRQTLQHMASDASRCASFHAGPRRAQAPRAHPLPEPPNDPLAPPGLIVPTPVDDALQNSAAWPTLEALEELERSALGAALEELERSALGEALEEPSEQEPLACAQSGPSSLTIADVIRTFGPEYLRRHGDTLTVQQDRVLRELMACRTAALGKHEWTCEDCGATVELPNSCGNRHCPACQEKRRQQWARGVAAVLLPIPYQHVMLTLPRPLSRLAIAHPRVMYPIMLRTCGEAIMRCGRRLFRAQLGLLLVLHTWGQLLNAHIHCHVLLAWGGLLLDGSGWITLSGDQIKELLAEVSKEFRDLFLKELRSAHARGELKFREEPSGLESAEAFEQWLSPVRDITWVIRAPGIWDGGEAAGDPEATLRTVRYVARYVNRIAISNSRLLGIQGDQVLLRYKDYRDGNRWKVKAIDGVQFMRRFLRHLLPPRLRHIRRCGFMGARLAPEKRAWLRSHFGLPDPSAPQEAEGQEAQGEQGDETETPAPEEEPTRPCRECRGRMHLTDHTPRPTVREILEMPWIAIERAQRGIVRTPGTAAARAARGEAGAQRRESSQGETEGELLPSSAHL